MSYDMDQILDAIVTKHYCVVDDFLSQEETTELRNDLINLDHEGEFKSAGIGRNSQHQLNTEIRRDRICWLTGEGVGQSRLFEKLSELQQSFNQGLYLGIKEFEAQYAIYEKEGFYKKHKDSFEGAENRILSCVLYLNETWSDRSGGELEVFDEESNQVVTQVQPKGGRLVVFLSEKVPHQVLPTNQTRYSIAIWFRRSQGGI